MKTLLPILLLATACGYPDRRDSDVVVENEELLEATEEGLKIWQDATNDVSSRVSKECTWVRHCVTVKFSRDMAQDALGRTESFGNPINGTSWSTVKIRPDAIDVLLPVITHELGHTFDLEHVSENVDVMFKSQIEHATVTESSLKQWREIYGTHATDNDEPRDEEGSEP